MNEQVITPLAETIPNNATWSRRDIKLLQKWRFDIKMTTCSGALNNLLETTADGTAVHFPYRSAQWTEFVLYLHGHTTTHPTDNRWDKIRYLNVRNHLIQLYKAPRNFLRTAITQADRVNPVSAPPANGRPG